VVVLKCLPSHHEHAHLLEAEARRTARLSHPNLVRLHATLVDTPGPSGPVTGLATRWIDGDPWGETLRAQSPGDRLATWGRLVAGVDYLHRQGWLHLDLKPSNVLLTDAGPVLLDLGSACRIDGIAGQAGGTLGYAAPEVLAGQAPSVAADLYGLGVLLYEGLSGATPFGAAKGSALRQQVLAGSPVPLRAVAPGVPRPIAALVDSLLRRDPGARPLRIHDVLEELAAAGVALPTSRGAPTLVGRGAATQELVEVLSEDVGGAVALIGPPGSGRTRLARSVLRELEAGSRLCVDLGDAPDVLAALHGLLAAAGAELSPPGDRWLPDALVALERIDPVRGVVFLGRWEDRTASEARTLEALLPALSRVGLRALVAARRPPSGARPVPLRPLRPLDLEALALEEGVPPGSQVQQASERSGGHPGAFLRLLLRQAQQAEPLPPALAASLEALRTLPSPMPARAVAQLPTALRQALDALARLDRAHRDARGAWALVEAEGAEALHPTLADPVPAWLADTALDPLWRGVVAVRAGRTQDAAAVFPDAVDQAAGRRELLLECTRGLAESGHPEAQRALARMNLEDGDHAGALRALADLSDLAAVRLRIEALLRGGRAQEACAVAREALVSSGAAVLALDLSRACVALEQLDDAQAALDQALALDPALGDGEALGPQALIAVHRLDAGEEVPGLERLLLRVQAQPGLPARTLSTTGRILARRGLPEQGEQLLAQAAERADQDGDLRLGAICRLNRGNVLLRLGQAHGARRAYRASLLVARGIPDGDPLRLRLSYSLAELALRRGRLPDARRHLSEFQVVARSHGGPPARARGALLQSWLWLEEARPADALNTLEALDADGPLAGTRSLLLARALLALERPAPALAVLEALESRDDPGGTRELHALRGLAYVGLGREELQAARALVPDSAPELDQADIGRVLLATAGENLDPREFSSRRADLDRAAQLLRGRHAGRAASLRDRLLASPGAALARIVELTEALPDTQAFPEALATLVAEALGAHRVLIMLRLPGLGRQVSFRELSGNEVAGISAEVLRRIRRPEDTWVAADAFADPALREVSATVRTFEIKSLVAVAIPREDTAIGALYVDDLHRAHRFDPADVALLQRLGRAVGRIIGWESRPGDHGELLEPVDVHGVVVSRRELVAGLQDGVALVDARRGDNLLVSGPTGAGKTWFARRLATEVLGCTGLEEVVLSRGDAALLVSALAGTRRGDFTGALNRSGAIQQALQHGRALFLDEVQNLDDRGQQVLLPLLELPERRFAGIAGPATLLGGRLHVILGTNAHVAGGAWEEHFREDLWYRMSRNHLVLPGLAERGREALYRYLGGMLEDEELGSPETVFTGSALRRVGEVTWPGNLRELRTFAQKSALLHRHLGRRLGEAELVRCGLAPSDVPRGQEHRDMDAAQREAVLGALERSGYVQAEAARVLGISKWRLHRMLKGYDLLDWVRGKRER